MRKRLKLRKWKWDDRRKFQDEVIEIIEKEDPACGMVNTIAGLIFDCLVFDYPKENGD